MRQDILGSPMAKTFQMVGWDIPNEEPGETEPDDIAWINEKSREELKELLVKADVLIKERENGGRISVVILNQQLMNALV